MTGRIRRAAIAAVTPFVMAGAAKRAQAQTAPENPVTPEVATAPTLAPSERCNSQWLLGFDYTYPQGLLGLIGNRYERADCKRKLDWVMGLGSGTGRLSIGVPLSPKGSDLEVIPAVTLVGIKENRNTGLGPTYGSNETFVGPRVEVGGRDFPFRAGVAVLYPTSKAGGAPRLSVGLSAIF
jgi:hypothetical protein